MNDNSHDNTSKPTRHGRRRGEADSGRSLDVAAGGNGGGREPHDPREPRDDDFATFGRRHGWGADLPFGLSRADRRQHVYAVGKTGTGKSTLLRNLILQDIEAGEGVGVIDPHGDLSEELLNFIPRWRTDHLVYFNPSDLEHPLAWNLLKDTPPESRPLVASGIVGCFKGLWKESWGPRLEYILYATVAALLDCPNTTLLGVSRMLSDARYRRWVVEQVKDPLVRSFWEDEFEHYDERFRKEAVAPVQNKVGQLLMAAPLRNVLGQVKSKVDPAFVMDRGRILIANLSKGRLGEDKANLLGSLLVSAFQQAAMSRASIPEHERKDFHLYIDEFHNFTTDAFASILSEARKYRLCLLLSHQYTAQVREDVRDAVFGNVGTLISFRVGEGDAALLAREFGGEYLPSTFSELPNHHVLVKPLPSEWGGAPFLGKTLPPSGRRYGRGYNLIARSRQRYATPRRVVEGKIARWLRR